MDLRVWDLGLVWLGLEMDRFWVSDLGLECSIWVSLCGLCNLFVRLCEILDKICGNGGVNSLIWVIGSLLEPGLCEVRAAEG